MPQTDQKNSSTSTILAMFNNMLGTALLSLPIVFRDTGLISSTIVLAFSAIISYVTCRIYVLHANKEDKDVEWTIRRILGKKWERNFRMITGAYLILLCIIMYDLIVDQFYSIIYYIFKSNNWQHHIAGKDQIQFGMFSTQWLSLVLIYPLIKLVSLKNMAFLVKLSEYGSFSIFIFAAFVISQFIVALSKGNIDMGGVHWFSFQAIGQAGTGSLAFTLHTIAITIMKQNRNQDNNLRDLGITYALGFTVYEIVAVLGTLAISTQQCSNTIINCYLHEWTILLVSISFILGRITVVPCTLEVGRTRILQIFTTKISTKQFKYFNFAFVAVATLSSIFSPILSASLLMNIVGALVCYLFIYLIPTKIHYACLYPRKKQAKQEAMSVLIEDDVSTCTSVSQKSCCSHDQNYVNRTSLLTRRITYGLINIVGLCIGVFGLYTSANQVLNF